MSCLQTLSDYGLRALGIGERILPKTDITLCEQVVLMGSGLVWNVYFAFFALLFGFFAATAVALGKASSNGVVSNLANAFIYTFRGTPLFIQFFFAYELFVILPKVGFEFDLGFVTIAASTSWLTKAWLGALLVLFLNTTAYSAHIFHGALMSVPRGDIEAAKAYGMSGFTLFRRITWPTMLRLAWPSYTNEAIFLFHATTLVFFSSFPAWRQEGDALYYAKYFFEKTFNPFVTYPIAAAYFVVGTLFIISLFSYANRRLNRHLDPALRTKISYKPQIIR